MMIAKPIPSSSDEGMAPSLEHVAAVLETHAVDLRLQLFDLVGECLGVVTSRSGRGC